MRMVLSAIALTLARWRHNTQPRDVVAQAWFSRCQGMSLPRKGARALTHGQHHYRWYVRRKPTYCQGAFSAPMNLAIERIGDEPGTVLLVNLRVSRPDNWIGPHQTALTPAVVREIIASALEAGWNPGAQGSAFEYDHGLIKERA